MSLLIKSFLIVLLLAPARGPPAHAADLAVTTCAVEGVSNPAVTQENIKQTICKPGWSASVRPPAAYTNKIKRKLWIASGRLGKLGDFELDHCIAIEDGGDPRSVKNLWLQPWNGKCGAHAKDRIENFLHRQLCSGETTLLAAREAVKHWCSP